MTDYYVSPAGSNEANGLSPATPWLTLAYANSNTTAGDVIYHLSGGTWADQYYSFSDSRTLDIYNGSSRAVFDFDGSDNGTYFAIITSTATISINSIDIRNNLSGNDQTDGGRGIAVSGSDTTIDDCAITNVGANGITRDFGGDTISVTNCVLENIASLWVSGIYAGGIAPPGDSNAVDGWTVTDNQILEVHGEAISAFTFNTSVLATNVLITDNDICGGHAAGIYMNGVNGADIRKNMVLGTSNTSYHRSTGYVGYGLAQDNESASSTTNNDIVWALNLVAFCSPGFYVSSGVGTAITNMHVAHNTFVDCDNTIGCIAGSSFSGAGNVFRQNASILITGGTAHDDGTNVPGGSDWDKDENYWEGGGEASTLNDATDFDNSVWVPTKASGWQSIDDFGQVSVADFRPDTQALGTQFTDPYTSSNFADYQSVANLREAGALVNTPATANKRWLILK